MNNITDKVFYLFTCVKNGRPFIRKLFDSLLHQTRFNFVHYIYEDGSTDDIEDLVNEYRAAAPYEVIYEKNSINIGLNLATMKCIKKCFLPFFIWIDCDNWVEYNFFEELEKLYKKNKNAVVLRTRRMLIDTNGKVISEPLINNQSIKAKKGYDHFLIFNNYYYSFFAVSMAEYKKINPAFNCIVDRDFFNDQQVLFACAKSKKRYVYNKNAIGYCTIRNDSESATNFNNSDEFRINHFQHLNDLLHVDEIDYTEIKECLRLQTLHKDLFSKHNYIDSRRVLSRKRKLFLKNKINNAVLPFCDNSLFSFVYFISPKLALKVSRILNLNKK